MDAPETTASDPHVEVLLLAVKETARGACHLADVAARCAGTARREGPAPQAAAQAAMEAGLRASRTLFQLEDALGRTEEDPAVPLAEALRTLQAAEEAIHAARLAIEARLSRTLRPDVPVGGTRARP